MSDYTIMNIIKHLAITFIVVVFSLGVKAQDNKIAAWRIISPKDVVTGSRIELLFKVNIKPFWHIHSVNVKDRNRKNTTIWFRENGDFKIIGKPEAVFEIEIFNKYSNKVEYIIEDEGGLAQKIKILTPNPTINGRINYVLCNIGNNQVISQVYHFEIQLKTKNN